MSHEIKILLYIIIGIAYLFSRMYKKELKKQNQKKINKRPVSSKTAKDIFRDLQKTLNLPSEESLKPSVGQTVKERKIDDKLSRAQKIFVSASESKLKHYKPIQASKLKKKDDAETFHHQTVVEEEYGPKIDFEPRKAMIFSEILKKPQY